MSSIAYGLGVIVYGVSADGALTGRHYDDHTAARRALKALERDTRFVRTGYAPVCEEHRRAVE